MTSAPASASPPPILRGRQKWNARAKALFLPKEQWVGEWDGRTLRLLAFSKSASGLLWGERFSGDLKSGEEWASARGIPKFGLELALTVPGLQIKCLHPGEMPEDGHSSPEENLVRELSPGLETASLEIRTVRMAEATYSAHILHEGLETLAEGLTERLGGLFSMDAGLFSVWQCVDGEAAPLSFVALLATSDEILVSIRDHGRWVVAYAIAWPAEESGAAPEVFLQAVARLLRQCLEYHYPWQFNAARPQAIQIWRDREGLLAKALECNLWAATPPSWLPGIKDVSEDFRPAAALALAQTRSSCPRLDFGPIGIEHPKQIRKRRERTGQFFLVAMIILAFVGISELILSAGVGVMLRVEAKESRKWSEPLSKWERLKWKRQSLIEKWDQLGPVLSQGNKPAQRFAKLSNTLPPDAWLERWQFVQDVQGVKNDLTGYALEDSLIPIYVRRLQASGEYREVRLRATEKLSAEKVEELTRLKANHRILHRFELVVSE